MVMQKTNKKYEQQNLFHWNLLHHVLFVFRSRTGIFLERWNERKKGEEHFG